MLKKSFTFCLFLLCGIVYGSQRVVVAEEFTGTWCGYCPGAARGLEEMYERVYDSLVVVTYHLSDNYATSESNVRATYYGVSGIPAVKMDGIVSMVGGLHYGTVYPTYRKNFNQRINIDSPLEIGLECTYRAAKDSGTVEATITNTSAGSVNGTLQFIIVENNIDLHWQGMNKLDFVERDMLPDANGEAVTIPAGDSITRERNFYIQPDWDEENCKIVVFVQGTTKEIYQGAEIGVIQKAEMQYYGLSVERDGTEDICGPGDTLAANVLAKNFGTGDYNERTSIQSDDPYINIIDYSAPATTVSPGDVDTVIAFTIYVDPSCPDPHNTELLLNFLFSADTIPLLITTQSGFSDDIESGDSAWTHCGTRDNWHITNHDGYSPRHSWYCGVENSWQYTNENDASLISPYFVVTPDTAITLYQRYSLENGWDYGYIEIDDGSGWWKTLGVITGTNNVWEEVSYPLGGYSAQTVRVRFRFISDYNTTSEGWYIDDISMPILVGVDEKDSHLPTVTLLVHPTVVRYHTNIAFGSETDDVSLAVYDISGRLVKTLTPRSTDIVWNCEDEGGNRVSGGIYFVRLTTNRGNEIAKLVVLGK